MSESQQSDHPLNQDSEFDEAQHAEADVELNETNETDLDADAMQHGTFDDAPDDFAYEEQIETTEELAACDMEDSNDEVEYDESSRRQAKRQVGRRSKTGREPFADYSFDDGDSDNDPTAERPATGAQTAKFAPQRLAKILAAAGIDARRKCEEYVTTGRVTVDGEVITDVAFRADPYSQRIELDGERIKLQRKVYFALNKPRGVVCTNFDPAGRTRVIDLFPQFKERLFAIGRLDEESEGLLLVTNDGELANRMAHPRYRVAKFYLCHVKGVPSAETLASLKRGMYFEEGKFHVEGVRLKKAVGDSAYLEIVLNEGQNREIRRLMARVGHKVMRLKRVGFGPIRLGDLPSGAFRALNSDELRLVKDLSEQRAYLDNTAGRGRKKKFANKRGFGSRSDFGSQPPYGERPPRRKFVSQANDEVLELGHEGGEDRGATGQRVGRRPRPSGYEPRGNYESGQRGYRGRNQTDQTSGSRRPRRRDEGQGEPQESQRRYSRGGGNAQGAPRGRARTAQAGGGNRRRYSQAEGYDQQTGYSSRPPRANGDAVRGNRPPRRFHNATPGGSVQAEAMDNDFGGGRRRFVTDETPESSFSRRPPRGARPQRRRYVSDEAGQTQESSGGYSAQRRPAGGPRRYGQAGNRELPARGRGRRPAPPARPMTADGKEILQGKVTGYRTAPKEGLARRRRKAVDGMQVTRKQRQQRRRKTED